MWSCKTQCPLPSCKIRTEHHHALNFENTKELKKEAKKEAKRIKDEQKLAEQSHKDSVATAEKKQEELANLDADTDQNLHKVEDEEQAKKKKKAKKEKKVKESDETGDDLEEEKSSKKKKRKKNEESNEEVNEELASTDKAAKKELKKADKESKRLEKESQEQAKEETKESKEADAVYRSRMIKWWKKNQNPKVGQQHKLPERKTKDKVEDYHWH